MRRLGLMSAVIALAIVAAACSGAGAATGSDPTLSIASPGNGATVSGPFTVKLDASVPIGDPTTGEHHVHLCFDGASCDELSNSVIAYQDSAKVTGLSAGMHTIEAALRNADHSDTGVSATITVVVSGGDMGSGAGAATGTTGPARGYGY